MKSKRLICVSAMTLLAVAMPVSLGGQNKARQGRHQHHHYQLIDMGTFGGPSSSFVVPAWVRLLNKGGAAVGASDTSTPDPYCIGFNYDCYVADGFKWHDGVASQLGALPGFTGLNNALASWISDNGLTVGVSENGIDPLTGNPAFEAILWGTDDSLTDLGTLGGNESMANAVNNRGQVAGGALNTIPDPYTSNYFNFFLSSATQVHAYRWTKSHGMQDLGTLGGSDSNAFLINERGQIAGWSFTNTTPNPVLDECSGYSQNVPTEDPFLWTEGRMIDLGSLGGTCGRATALNNGGQVVGFSALAGDLSGHAFLWRNESEGMKDLGTLGGNTGYAFFINDAGDVVGFDTLADGTGRGFLWRHGAMTDLGSLPGYQCSNAFSINERDQIVGVADLACDGATQVATLWQNGSIADLNTLIPPNSGLQIYVAYQNNDRGEIAAQANDANGNNHAILLIPCDRNHPGVEGCDYSMVEAEADAVAAVQVPKVARTPSGAMQNRKALARPGRLRARMARR